MNFEVDNARSLLDELRASGPSWRVHGPEIEGWKDRVRALVRRLYGDESPQVGEFDTVTWVSVPTSYVSPDPGHHLKLQDKYLVQLPRIIAHMEALVDDLQQRQGPGAVDQVPAQASLRIFIAHDGHSSARDKLERYLSALGAVPVIVELSPGGGKSPGTKVDLHLRDCHFGIVLARKSRGVPQNGKLLPRANVIDEMARLQSLLDDRRMLLLQSGLSLPSNASDWTYESFSPQSMDRAFIAIARELKGHRLLTVRGIAAV